MATLVAPSEKKLLSEPIQVKDDGSAGEFEAVFSTLDVIDHDGDIVKSSAINEGQMVPILWSHNQSDMPIGVGVISVQANKAIIKGTFIDSAVGRDARATVLATKGLQELSWGFRVKESGHENVNGQPVRVITETETHEVSFVLKGAGLGTGVRSVKNQTSFTDQIKDTRAAVEDLLKRVNARVELRAKDDRDIGKDAAEALSGFAEAMLQASSQVQEVIDGIVGDTDGSVDEVMDEMRRLRGRHVRQESLARY
jgi:HK97 family phage prohead protease